MPISGLVLTLADPDDRLAEFLASLATDARVSLGERFANQQPLTLETETEGESKDLVEEWSASPVVVHVDVVFVGWIQPDERDVWNLNVVNS